MEINQERIEAAIIDQAVETLVDDDALKAKLERAVDARISKIFAERADAQIAAAVDAAIKTGFEREYQRVDAFGQKKGGPTTISKELEKLVGDYWSQKVDGQGKPAEGYSAKMTRAEWWMGQVVAADFSDNMKQHMANVAGSLKDQLRLNLYKTVNELLSSVFNVRTEADERARKGTLVPPPPVEGN